MAPDPFCRQEPDNKQEGGSVTYEYRSGSQTLELPNPYLVENQIRFVTGGL